MYTIIIEQADATPRVVVFDNLDEATRFRVAYEQSTKGLWDGDPLWHNFPRHPERVMQPWEALELLRLEVEREKV